MMELIEFNTLPYREQVLNLHELTEEELYEWLDNHKVTKSRKIGGEIRLESLADCAFRLRDEFFNSFTDLDLWLNNLMDVLNKTTLHFLEAKAIHWIQAALLAKLKSEGE